MSFQIPEGLSMDARTNVIALKTQPASKAGRFDQVTIALHWLTLALVVGQFTTAWLLGAAGDDGAAAADLLTVHRTFGVVTWSVVALRLAWRAVFAHKPPFPARMPRIQQLAARLNEWGLYVLLLLQPLTGFGDSIFRGRPFVLAFWRLPSLTHANKAVFHALHALHEFGAIALLGLIGLHAAAALLHGTVLRDGVLQRMLPWTAADR
jgi:cytochrome b561